LGLRQACMPFVCSRMRLATLNGICAGIWNDYYVWVFQREIRNIESHLALAAAWMIP
jgi:hypothetical protein